MLTGMPITKKLVTVSGDAVVAPSTDTETKSYAYTCTCNPSSTDATYQWYVGSDKASDNDGGNTANFTYKAPKAEQYVNIYCEVTKDGYVTSNGFPVTVKNQ